MFKNIENKNIKIISKPEKIDLPEDLKNKIDEHWKSVINKNSNLWNGELICVCSFYEDDENIEIVCKKSNYAHYLYDERVGLPEKYACYNLAAGCFFETLDGYYVMGELDRNLSYPYCIQISGGSVDNQDIVGENVDFEGTMKREVKEELNIDLDNQEQVKEYQIKYINTPDDKEHSYEIFAKGILNMTASEMEQYYNIYLNYLRKNNLEVEFEKIHLIKKENALQELEKLPNHKREYLKLFIHADNKI